MQDFLLVFGETIKEIRRQKGLSQERLADLCHLHRTYIGGIERGERNVSLINILYLSNALGVPPQELFQKFNEQIMLKLPERHQ